MTVCSHCGSAKCRPRTYHVCIPCKGDVCGNCKDSIVPGLVEGVVDDAPLVGCCTEFGDPEIDALHADTMGALISALEKAKAGMIEELGATREF